MVKTHGAYFKKRVFGKWGKYKIGSLRKDTPTLLQSVEFLFLQYVFPLQTCLNTYKKRGMLI